MNEFDDGVSIEDLIARLRSKPELLNHLSRSTFEDLITELLAANGWQVSPTNFGQGRGYDILAISRDALGFETTWLVDCREHLRKRLTEKDLRVC